MGEIPYENSTGDIFADLGFSPAESQDLTAKSNLIIAIKDVMEERSLTQKVAADFCGTDQPTLSKVLHGRMESVTIDRLTNWLTALGQDVEITIKPAVDVRLGHMSINRIKVDKYYVEKQASSLNYAIARSAPAGKITKKEDRSFAEHAKGIIRGTTKSASARADTVLPPDGEVMQRTREDNPLAKPKRVPVRHTGNGKVD